MLQAKSRTYTHVWVGEMYGSLRNQMQFGVAETAGLRLE